MQLANSARLLQAARLGGVVVVPTLKHPKNRIQCSALPKSLLKTFFENQAGAPVPGLLAGVMANTAVFTLGFGILRKGLSVEGIMHAWFLGACVYSAFGPGGYSLLCLYFILGTLVTKLKLKQKQAEGIAEARSGQRGPAGVWGSGLAAALCAVLALSTGNSMPWQVGFVASVTSKLSDTVSSEVGKAYGKTTYLITTFERVPRGTEGAVSLEGTIAGVVSAICFSAAAWAMGQVSMQAACVASLAAFIANTFESFLGALVQGKVEWLTNDRVNMVQICLAAVLAIITCTFFQL